QAMERERKNLPKGRAIEVPNYRPPTIISSSSIVGRGSATRTIIHLSEAETAKHHQYKKIVPIVAYVLGQGQRIQYLRLRKELTESANFEINQDRDKLLGSLTSLGFSDKLTDFLKFAEVEFAKTQGTFSYKTCI